MDKNKLINHQEFHISKSTDNNSNPGNKGKLDHDYNLRSKCYSIRSVSLTPDDRFLIVTNANNPKIRVIDLELLEHLPHQYNHHKKSVRMSSVTGDGSAFYTASWDGTCNRYEIETGIYKSIVASNEYPKPSCYISPDERYFFTSNYEAINGLNSANKGICRDLKNNITYKYPHKNRKQQPGAMDVFYDQKYVYTGSDDGSAYKWSLKEQKALIQYFDLPLTVRKIAVSKRLFAASCSDGIVRVYNKKTGVKYLHLIHNPTEDALDVRITKDETKIVSACSDGTIKCYNLLTGKTLFKKKAHFNWIWSMGLFSNDQLIVSGSTDGSVVFMTIEGEIRARYFNLIENQFLITCPAGNDKVFPNGCFFTTNNKLIKVLRHNKELRTREVLPENDKDRLAYIDSLNRKNIVISKLRNNSKYESLSDNYLKRKGLLRGAGDYHETPLLLG